MIMMMAKGRALMTEPACSALRPLASNRAMATSPAMEAQKTRCHTGVLAAPPEARESMTSEPESDEVTKNRAISNTVMKLTTDEKGKRSNSLRSEEHTSELQSRGHLVCRLL